MKILLLIITTINILHCEVDFSNIDVNVFKNLKEEKIEIKEKNGEILEKKYQKFDFSIDEIKTKEEYKNGKKIEIEVIREEKSNFQKGYF